MPAPRQPRDQSQEKHPDVDGLAATVFRSVQSTDPGTSHVDTAAIVPRLGRFELEAVVGSGSFGTVFRAKDTQLQRIVALKVPKSGVLISDVEIERFLREARAAAHIRHPNIVPVYDAGKEGDNYYIASAFVEGWTLRSRLQKGLGRNVRDSAVLVKKLAEALHCAHVKGIIHRDVKPENIMVTPDGEPHLMDFGLARRADVQAEQFQTNEGMLIGTPAYMSPEQAQGKSHLADARSDVWSLGVVMYELLTGTLPFASGDKSLPGLVRAISETEPVRLRRRDKHVPRDLETICLRCLAKDANQRYPSAQHLAEDLQRWLEHRPIAAKPTSSLQRIAKWVRRKPFHASVLGAVLFVAAGLIVFDRTRPGYVDLRVMPKNAQVEFDGQSVVLNDGGALLRHPPGRYHLTVTAPEYHAHQQEVSLVRGRNNSLLLSIDLRSIFGHMEVDTVPSGAAVTVRNADGSVAAQGTTPFRSSTLASGTYVVAFQLDMYLPQVVSVDVPNGLRTAKVPSQSLTPAVQGARSAQSLNEYRQLMDERLDPTNQLRIPATATLNDLALAISSELHIPTFVDTKSLSEMGISSDLQIGKAIAPESHPTLKSIESLVLSSHNLAFKWHQLPHKDNVSHALVITTVIDAYNTVITVLHPIGDLVRGASALDGDELAAQIQNEVAPESWARHGGPGRLSYMPIAGSLVVVERWPVQNKIYDYLQEIRRARATNERLFPQPAAEDDIGAPRPVR